MTEPSCLAAPIPSALCPLASALCPLSTFHPLSSPYPPTDTTLISRRVLLQSSPNQRNRTAGATMMQLQPQRNSNAMTASSPLHRTLVASYDQARRGGVAFSKDHMLASIAASTNFVVRLGHISVVSDVLVVASYDRAPRSFQHHFVDDASQ